MNKKSTRSDKIITNTNRTEMNKDKMITNTNKSEMNKDKMDKNILGKRGKTNQVKA